MYQSPVTVLSAGSKADKNIVNLFKGWEGNAVTVMHMCLTLCMLRSIFFIHVLILFPTEVFTVRHILFSFYRYASQCACPRDGETA